AVGASALRGDEAEAFLRVEALHGARSHVSPQQVADTVPHLVWRTGSPRRSHFLEEYVRPRPCFASARNRNAKRTTATSLARLSYWPEGGMTRHRWALGSTLGT